MQSSRMFLKKHTFTNDSGGWGIVLANRGKGAGFDSHRIFHFSSLLQHIPWTLGLSSLASFLSDFLYLSFPEQFASLTLLLFLPSCSLLNSHASCTKLTNGLCSLSLFPIIPISAGTQLSGRNWCSSPAEAGKKYLPSKHLASFEPLICFACFFFLKEGF